MGFQPNRFKVNHVTLTCILLVAMSNVRSEIEFTHTDVDIRRQIDTLTKARYLLFPHIYRAFIDAGRSPAKYNVSEGCHRDLTRYYHALNEQKAWAWRFYDATGKQGSGLFMGALTWKGNFQECLNTLNYETHDTFFNHDEHEPQAQYCSVFLATPDWLQEIVTSLDLPFPVPLTPFIADICVPADCTELDLQHVVHNFVTENAWGNMTFTVTDTRCFHGRHIDWDPSALWTVALLVFLACCVFCGTAYDIYLRRRKLRVKHGPEFMIGYKKDTRQYGILKVIMAPPPRDKLRRRNTIGGYETTGYQLAEIKVNKGIVLERKASSEPDVTSLASEEPVSPVSTGSGTLPDFQLPATNTDAKNGPLATKTATVDTISSPVNAGRYMKHPLTRTDNETIYEAYDETPDPSSEVKSPLLNDAQKQNATNDSDTTKNNNTDSFNTTKDNNTDSFNTKKDNNTGSFNTTKDTADLESGETQNKSRSRLPLLKSLLGDALLKPSPERKARSEQKKVEHLKLSSSDPGKLDNQVEHDPSSPIHAIGNLEIDVSPPVSPAGNLSPFEARMPGRGGPPRKIKHTPGSARQGSVYERQVSSVSEEDDDSVFGATPHTLYNIPEESPMSNFAKGNDGIKPEVVIRKAPIVRGLSLLRDMILSFSFRRSTKRVMAEGSGDTLFCLNGVRVLSIAWIVLGNVYMILYLNPDVVDNHVDGVKLTQTLWVQAVINTTLAADSFYILSGTLGAYNFMKSKKDCKGKSMSEVMTWKEYGMIIFHRLVRIGPCYWLAILLFTNLMPYMGKGPRWTYEIQAVATCKDKWWANAFFFSNFYEADSMCMPHTYYLVNDFQFGLLSPLFLIPLLCMPEVGFMMLAGLVVIQILSTLILNQGINGNVLRMGNTDYFSKVYVKPYCRMGVYAIGMGLGYILHATKRQIKFRRIPLLIFWLLALVVVAVLPYITYLENRAGGRKWTGMETAVFEALSRPLWGLALAWVIYACSTGQGAFINKLLSWNAFVPLCRITYGVYLLHPMLIAVVISSRHNGVYIDFAELSYEFVANLAVSYLLAFVLITFVECPFVCLESNVRAHIGQRKKK